MDLTSLSPLKDTILSMRCPIIGVPGLKGGPGKTTVSVNIAWAFKLMGLNVLLVDSDHGDQLTAAKWASITPEDNRISCVQFSDAQSLKQELPKFRNLYDVIVVDGRPNENLMAATLIKLSDLVIIPAKPSPIDFWRINDTIELTQSRMEIDDKLKAAVLLNGTKHNSNSDIRMRSAIEENFNGFPVFKSTMSYVDPYQVDVGLGRGVLSRGDNENVAFEFKKLMLEIGEVLNG